MEDGLIFKIFRHMNLKVGSRSSSESIFIVRFKFKKFSHRVNKRLSKIPILLIAGFPGFRDKLWMIDRESGYWQGIYQWKNVQSIENYKNSFVLRLMNRRAIANTIKYTIVTETNIIDYIRERLLK